MVKGDPYWITVRATCPCRKCGQTVMRGEQGWYWPKGTGSRVECESCGKGSEQRFRQETAMETW